MLSSMTGFATYQVEHESILISWELKTVNHRYLDMSFRLPESYRYLENGFRERAKLMISRGKLDIQLKLKDKQMKNNDLAIDMDRVKQIVEQITEANKGIHNVSQLSWDTLITIPDVLVEVEKQALSEVVLFEALDKGLQLLSENRQLEGNNIHAMISERLNGLMAIQEDIAKQVNGLNEQIKDKLQTRIDKIAMEVHEDRLIQEIAILLTKMDVAEELDRIKSHCQQIEKALAMNEPVGRRLDFLMQELNREVNTLGVKVDDVHVRKQSVEMKVLIEQMREQIQNVE